MRELEGALLAANSGSPASAAETPHSSVRSITHQDRDDLGLDKDRNLEYYGATSRFHVAATPGNSQDRAQQPNRVAPPVDEAYHKKWLLSNARFRQKWEKVAYNNLSSEFNLDSAAMWDLLKIYWTWQAPLHNCVYRPCFVRDMALGGPYFSPFLLNVILSHACRHARPEDIRFNAYDSGEYFLRKAEQLLVEELRQERPRIPTIQGLLILGGRQCAVGKSSQGWLFTGMAVTMLKDLGLHLPRVMEALSRTMDPEDIEVRKRLFLSAYAWDKSISLTLGRQPSLVGLPYEPLQMLFDHSDDEEHWTPWYLGRENDYPLQRGYITSTFSHFFEHAQIIEEIYAVVYSDRSRESNDPAIAEIDARLRQFYHRLPTHIRVDDVHSLSHCPPPHIFALNVLYHTSLILLYRPFFKPDLLSPSDAFCETARRVCVEEAATVNQFFQAYGDTFDFRNQTYLTSYCVYTAATIEVLQVQNSPKDVSTAAVHRLATTLRMLEAEAAQTPGIRRSVDIIKAQLDKLVDQDGTAVPIPEGLWDRRDLEQRHPPTDIVQASSGDASGENMQISEAALLPSNTTEPPFRYDGREGATMPSPGYEMPNLELDWFIENAGGGFVPDMSWV